MVGYTHIQFMELAILKAIIEYWAANGRAPSKDLLFPTLVNDWLKNAGAVEAGYTNPLTSNTRFTQAIKALRRLGYLTDSRFYTPSETAPALFEQLGNDWREWPVRIPILGNILNFDEATHPLK